MFSLCNGYVVQIGLFNFGMTISQREEKPWIQIFSAVSYYNYLIVPFFCACDGVVTYRNKRHSLILLGVVPGKCCFETHFHGFDWFKNILIKYSNSIYLFIYLFIHLFKYFCQIQSVYMEPEMRWPLTKFIAFRTWVSLNTEMTMSKFFDNSWEFRRILVIGFTYN